MPLAPGSTIGRYRIESRLGGGAMGVVYLALDPRLERRVALKLIEPSLAADPDFRARFEREARAAAALDHPHVLPVYEAGEDDGQLYLAMRYVPGVDLATHLARHGPLDLPTTRRLVNQLAAALDAAHATGLIHRDVKPANVLLAPNEHAYLADFGLARSAGPGITRPGQLVGTADYTAPELLRGASASPASDTYALACLTVECLTGRPPFGRGDEMATLYAHAHDPVPPLVEQRPELPAGLQAVVERGLAKDPADRYTSAGELAGALEGAAGTNDAFQPSSSPPSRRIIAALAVPLVMAIALIGASLIREGAGQEADGSPSQAATTSAPRSASSGPSAEPSFPTTGEVALLALIPAQYRESCVRADPAERPIVLAASGRFQPPPGQPPIIHAGVSAGVDCDLGGIAAPDRLSYWDVIPDQSEHGIDDSAQGALYTHGGIVGASPGECREGTPAIEQWSFGGTSGRLVCYETNEGDAVLLWVVDDARLFAKAVRHDRDMAALLDWWDEVGRFVIP